jgi:hypothetical protein
MLDKIVYVVGRSDMPHMLNTAIENSNYERENQWRYLKSVVACFSMVSCLPGIVSKCGSLTTRKWLYSEINLYRKVGPVL